MSKDILRNSDIDREAVFYEFSVLKLGQLQCHGYPEVFQESSEVPV
jgi:hypothetical protein